MGVCSPKLKICALITYNNNSLLSGFGSFNKPALVLRRSYGTCADNSLKPKVRIPGKDMYGGVFNKYFNRANTGVNIIKKPRFQFAVAVDICFVDYDFVSIITGPDNKKYYEVMKDDVVTINTANFFDKKLNSCQLEIFWERLAQERALDPENEVKLRTKLDVARVRAERAEALGGSVHATLTTDVKTADIVYAYLLIFQPVEYDERAISAFLDSSCAFEHPPVNELNFERKIIYRVDTIIKTGGPYNYYDWGGMIDPTREGAGEIPITCNHGVKVVETIGRRPMSWFNLTKIRKYARNAY